MLENAKGMLGRLFKERSSEVLTKTLSVLKPNLKTTAQNLQDGDLIFLPAQWVKVSELGLLSEDVPTFSQDDDLVTVKGEGYLGPFGGVSCVFTLSPSKRVDIIRKTSKEVPASKLRLVDKDGPLDENEDGEDGYKEQKDASPF